MQTRLFFFFTSNWDSNILCRADKNVLKSLTWYCGPLWSSFVQTVASCLPSGLINPLNNIFYSIRNLLSALRGLLSNSNKFAMSFVIFRILAWETLSDRLIPVSLRNLWLAFSGSALFRIAKVDRKTLHDFAIQMSLMSTCFESVGR